MRAAAPAASGSGRRATRPPSRADASEHHVQERDRALGVSPQRPAARRRRRRSRRPGARRPGRGRAPRCAPAGGPRARRRAPARSGASAARTGVARARADRPGTTTCASASASGPSASRRDRQPLVGERRARRAPGCRPGRRAAPSRRARRRPGRPQPSSTGAPKLRSVRVRSRSIPSGLGCASDARAPRACRSSPGGVARTPFGSAASSSPRPGRRRGRGRRSSTSTERPGLPRRARSRPRSPRPPRPARSARAGRRGARAGAARRSGWNASWWSVSPTAQAPPPSGCAARRPTDTGRDPYAAHAQRAAGRAQRADGGRTESSPRGGIGSARRCWVRIATSSSSFQGTGVSARPATPPPRPSRRSRRETGHEVAPVMRRGAIGGRPGRTCARGRARRGSPRSRSSSSPRQARVPSRDSDGPQMSRL